MARAKRAAAEPEATTRERILAAALEVFAERGFDGARVRDIAERAGANLGLLTYYFTDKQQLWKAAVASAFAELAEELGGVLGPDGGDELADLERIVRHFVGFVARRPAFMQLMNDEGKRDGPRMRWLADTHVRPLYEGMRRRIERAQSRGLLAPMAIGAPALHRPRRRRPDLQPGAGMPPHHRRRPDRPVFRRGARRRYSAPVGRWRCDATNQEGEALTPPGAWCARACARDTMLGGDLRRDPEPARRARPAAWRCRCSTRGPARSCSTPAAAPGSTWSARRGADPTGRPRLLDRHVAARPGRAPRADLVRADLNRSLPVAPGAFDAVLSCLVSEHLTDLGRFFRETFAALRRGGRLVFSAFHPELARAGVEANFQCEGTEYRLGAERHAVDDYLGHIADAGFTRLRWREHVGDEALAGTVPAAAKYIGRPLLLLIDAERPA